MAFLSIAGVRTGWDIAMDSNLGRGNRMVRRGLDS